MCPTDTNLHRTGAIKYKEIGTKEFQNQYCIFVTKQHQQIDLTTHKYNFLQLYRYGTKVSCERLPRRVPLRCVRFICNRAGTIPTIRAKKLVGRICPVLNAEQ